jgi:hypothetical protein
VLLDLQGGDPIQRNLAAHALAQPDATGSLAQRMVWLAGALEDEYPSVRWFAWRGLRTLAQSAGEDELLTALADFDYLAPIEPRVEVIGRIHAQLGPTPTQHDDLFDELAQARAATAIWIGE